MNLSELPHIKKKIEEHKTQVAAAKQKGLEVRGSVNGPYVFDPVNACVVGRKGSQAYQKATS